MSYDVSQVVCASCGYSWVAVRPSDAGELECPKCGNFGTKEVRINTMENEQLYLAEMVCDYLVSNNLYECEKAVLARFRFENVCKDSGIGEYRCQVQTSHGYCCDTCLQEELHDLWGKGVHTVGSCCGHGRMKPYIQVTDGESVQKMHTLGYAARPVDDNGNGKNCFIPKTYLPVIIPADKEANK